MSEKLPQLIQPLARIVRSQTSANTFRVLFPEGIKENLRVLFKTFQGHPKATVLTSGVNWVELTTKFKGASMILYTKGPTGVKLESGYEICFNEDGEVSSDAIFATTSGKRKPIW